MKRCKDPRLADYRGDAVPVHVRPQIRSDAGEDVALGDGALQYGHESIVESYYVFAVGKYVAISPDVIVIDHPGYNRSRGPATVLSTRVNAHW